MIKKSLLHRYKLILSITIANIIMLIVINNFSLWIDEAYTAYFASQNSLHDLITKLLETRGSEAQMPGYLFIMWLFEKLFGHSEYALRLINIFFLSSFIFVLISLNFSRFVKTFTIIVVMLHPFIWYNLNEARYTISIFAVSGMTLLLTREYSEGKKNQFLIVSWLLLGTALNMLFLFFIPGIVLYLFFKLKAAALDFKLLLKDWLLPLLVFLPFFVLILLYYFFTVTNGVGGQRQTPGLGNVVFMIYEFIGLSGLGPPRNTLRTLNTNINYLQFLPAITFLLFITTSAIVICIRLYKSALLKKYIVHPLLKSAVFSFLLFFIVSYIVGFRFLGRHIVFILPFLIFYFSDFVEKLKAQFKKQYIIIFATIFFMFYLFSSLNLRFNYNYQKDDYKNTINYVLRNYNEKEDIFFVGDLMTASYYGLNFENISKPTKWIKLRNANVIDLSKDNPKLVRGNSVVIYAKKNDIFDQDFKIKSFINSNNFIKVTENKDFIIYE